MYPFIRFVREMWSARRQPKLPVTGVHVSTHRCWPWDIDPWVELNNGRTLTLYDLGRIPLAERTGLIEILRREKWGITIAGNSVRYRRRIRAFQRFTMVSHTIGWDARFLYMEQTLWSKGECCNHMLVRAAITSPEGIVAPARMLAVAGEPDQSPPLPDWVTAWIEADAQRPWPPVLPTLAPTDPNEDLPR
ncbi:acyl-CoA thioesterase [Paracoccus aminophilus]|uniref:Thioesterase n=1 Tax=Paracoccus aminophilus JCM 7686 TaxID=1367847 RepID=S5XVL8_PARAH|nr:acyl-CoA thioesterase [Paracoccus aminophilus]AGT07435.1 hypothetical protein JCM7686_0326 [Paracoccus aminophilus JCM 7686]